MGIALIQIKRSANKLKFMLKKALSDYAQREYDTMKNTIYGLKSLFG